MTAKLELYRVFREVAETGNISAAAQNLYISQSAVSQSVKQLEGALQTRLFIRSPRGVTLTDDGQMLFEHVRSAMGLLETGEEKLAQTRALQMGKLVIGASDTVTSQFLLPHLDSFHKKYPNIHIQIISGRSHKVLGLLRSGKVDVAFASSPSEDEGLSCVPTLRRTRASSPRRTIPATLSAPIRCRSLRRCRSFCSSARPARACIWKNTSSRTAFPFRRRSSWAQGACSWTSPASASAWRA